MCFMPEPSFKIKTAAACLNGSRYLPRSQVQWLRELKAAINPALFCTLFWGQLKSPPISIRQLAAVSWHKQRSYGSPALCMSSAGITGPRLSSESGRFFFLAISSNWQYVCILVLILINQASPSLLPDWPFFYWFAHKLIKESRTCSLRVWCCTERGFSSFVWKMEIKTRLSQRSE